MDLGVIALLILVYLYTFSKNPRAKKWAKKAKPKLEKENKHTKIESKQNKKQT